MFGTGNPPCASRIRPETIVPLAGETPRVPASRAARTTEGKPATDARSNENPSLQATAYRSYGTPLMPPSLTTEIKSNFMFDSYRRRNIS